jgi:hypothetical protein
MTAQTRIEAPSRDREALACRIAIGLLLAVLLYRAALFAFAGLEAIRYPWQLDYGEGIIWQQMRWIFSAQAYGQIDQFPAIVFHYPPLYHAVTALTAAALGTDELATGRAISLLSTILAAVASARLVSLILEGRTHGGDRRLCSLIAGLLVFTFLPVISWKTVMRVDLLAVALSLFGLHAALRSLERPRFIYLACMLFVAAVYTKQTSIAAAAASFAVLLTFRPRLALHGIAICMAVGLAAFLMLGWLTDGGFYRHIFLYNVNRPAFGQLSWIAEVAWAQASYVFFAGFVLIRYLAELRLKYRGQANIRAALGNDVSDMRLLMAAAYALISTLMLVLVAKSGSSINYFLEWFFALGLFAAMAPSMAMKPGRYRTVLAIVVPLALAFEAATVPRPRSGSGADSPRSRELAQLSAAIASADKPVISDDMVLLIRSGREVLWEPAIFAELASTGGWDERPFVARIRNGEFAFFVTEGQRGHSRFDARYNPAVADAIDLAYPIKEAKAGLVVHRPRSQPAPALRTEPVPQ